MLRTFRQIHIPMAGLGEPTGSRHLSAAYRAQILRSRHKIQCFLLICQIVIHAPSDTAGQLRTVEAVLMTLQGCFIFLDTPPQIQSGADQRRMVGIAKASWAGRLGTISKISSAVFSAFWALEPSVWALKIIWALYHFPVQLSSMP